MREPPSQAAELRAFLTRCLSFFILLVAFSGVSRLVNGALLHAHANPWRDPPKVLIAGDSHAVRGVDPAELEEAQNVAQLADPIAVTSHLVKYLAEAAPELHTVVVAFSPHNIASMQDRALVEDWAHEMFRRYYGVVPWGSIEDLPIDRVEYVTSELRNLWVPNPHLLRDWLTAPAPEHPYLGGYQGLSEPPSPRQLEDVVRGHYPEMDRDEPVSEVQIRYLYELLDWSRERGVQIVLLATPMQEAYRRRIPDAVLQRYREVWSDATSREGVTGLDLSTLDLPEDAYMDWNHTSPLGAREVTRQLETLLR